MKNLYFLALGLFLSCGGSSESIHVESSQPHLTRDKEDLNNLLGLNEPRDTSAVLRAHKEEKISISALTRSERDSLIARIGDLMDEVMVAKRLVEEQAIVIDSLEGEIMTLKSGKFSDIRRDQKIPDEVRKDVTDSKPAKRVQLPKDLPKEKSKTAKDDGDPVRTAYREGVSLMKEQKFKTASAKFEKLLVQSPDHALAVSCQYQLAECYYMMGDYSQALVDFQKGLTFTGSVADAIKLRIGQCYLKLKKKDRARESFEKLVADHPKSSYSKIAKDYLAKL